LNYWQKEAMRKRGSGFALERLREAEPRFGALDSAALGRLIDDLIEENYTLPLLQNALSFLVKKPEKTVFQGIESWKPQLGPALRSVDPWDEETLNQALRAFMKERGLRGKEFFHPLRLILTGRERGAALPLVVCALGRDEVMSRLEG
jgi:glutamyl/glutaminyl-tRNA synthetase